MKASTRPKASGKLGQKRAQGRDHPIGILNQPSQISLLLKRIIFAGGFVEGQADFSLKPRTRGLQFFIDTTPHFALEPKKETRRILDGAIGGDVVTGGGIGG